MHGGRAAEGAIPIGALTGALGKTKDRVQGTSVGTHPPYENRFPPGPVWDEKEFFETPATSRGLALRKLGLKRGRSWHNVLDYARRGVPLNEPIGAFRASRWQGSKPL